MLGDKMENNMLVNTMFDVFSIDVNVTPTHREFGDYTKTPVHFLVDISTDCGLRILPEIVEASIKYPFIKFSDMTLARRDNIEYVIGMQKPVEFKIDLSYPEIKDIKYSYDDNKNGSYTWVDFKFRGEELKFPIERVC